MAHTFADFTDEDIAIYGMGLTNSERNTLELMRRFSDESKIVEVLDFPDETTDLVWMQLDRIQTLMEKLKEKYPYHAQIRHFPLERDIGFLKLNSWVRNALYVIGITRIKDLYRQKITATSRYIMVSPEQVMKDINKALRLSGLPELDADRPKSVIYKFFDPFFRTWLTEEEVYFLETCHWGNVPQDIAAAEIDIPEARVPYIIAGALKTLR